LRNITPGPGARDTVVGAYGGAAIACPASLDALDRDRGGRQPVGERERRLERHGQRADQQGRLAALRATDDAELPSAHVFVGAIVVIGSP
jgi:hypothetical protein